MKSKLAKLSVCIGLAVLALTTAPGAVHAKDVVGQCARLEAKVSKQAKTIKRLMKSKRKIPATMTKELKKVKRAFSVACEAEVCGDMNNAICEEAGGEFCITLIRPKTFPSIADMVQAGGKYLYGGECSDELNYGAPTVMEIN